MKKALFFRSKLRRAGICRSESGVTMILVAVCMVAIVAMAALSIDVVTLYLARMEAQRTADAAALAAARVISLSGITGDPNNTSGYWAQICGSGTPPGVATQAAQAAAAQVVDNVVPTPAVTVSYAAPGSSSGVPDCTSLSSTSASQFAINPTVIAQVTRSGLPTLFSRMWGRTSNTVSATAMAEAFNPSNSGSVSGGQIIPVQPRCVKPWMVPNQDPLNPGPGAHGYCNSAGGPGCTSLISTSDGSISHSGISLGGGYANGVIGETFWLGADCTHTGSGCNFRTGAGQPQANYPGNGYLVNPPNLLYVPGQAPASVVALPSSASGGDEFEQAVAGCDQSTAYQCGVQNANTVDLSENPATQFGDTTSGVQYLIQEGSSTASQPDGQDTITDTSYPFQMLAGRSNLLVVSGGLASGTQISASNSIVSLPIYDSANNTVAPHGVTSVTVVGFLQVFINSVDQYDNVSVTVLNVSGCGNGTNSTGNPVYGSSPVPVRLISQ